MRRIKVTINETNNYSTSITENADGTGSSIGNLNASCNTGNKTFNIGGSLNTEPADATVVQQQVDAFISQIRAKFGDSGLTYFGTTQQQ